MNGLATSAADIHVLNGAGVKIFDNYLGTAPEALGVTDCASFGVTRNSGYGIWADGGISGASLAPSMWIYGNRIACHSRYGIVMFGADGAMIGQTPGGASGRNYVGTNANGTVLPNGVGIGLVASGANGARQPTRCATTPLPATTTRASGYWEMARTTPTAHPATSWPGTGSENNGLTNGAGGIYVSEGALFNIIGGKAGADRDQLWGNHGNGISLFDSDGNGILGNVIGNAAGDRESQQRPRHLYRQRRE